MLNRTGRTARLTAVAAYFEEEFPGHVKAVKDNEFRISNEGMHHHVVLDPMFLKQCSDYTHALRETDLADYLRESRSRARRFVVMWYGHNTRIRSTSL
jgi:hypothetical protein